MNVFERALVFLGLAEEMEEEMEEGDVSELESTETTYKDELNHSKEPRKQPVKKKAPRQSEHNPVVPLHNQGLDQNKIYVLVPEGYEEAQTIGQYLKKGYPVIVNLEKLSNDAAKQLIDFTSGTVFALDGNLYKIGAHIFLFSPPNIKTEGDLAHLAEKEAVMDDENREQEE